MRILSVVLVLLAVTAAPAAASSLSVTAPASAEEESGFPAHVSGTADEPGLFEKAFVQNAACPATVVEAEAQPDAVGQNERGLGPQGPFEFDTTYGTNPFGKHLTGTVNLCSYLYRDTIGGDRSTLATDADSIKLRPKGSKPATLGVRIPASPKMAKDGSIRISVTCPDGCAVKVTFKGLGASKTVKRTLRASDSAVAIPLKLDGATKKAVKRARKNGKAGPKVRIDASAKPPTGRKKTAGKSVTVK
jgi:hypothetical protein